MKYHFHVTKDGSWFEARCIELEGCRTQAKTRDELLIRAHAVLNLYLDEAPGSHVLFPSPDDTLSANEDENVVPISVDADIAFGTIMRAYRISKQMTQAQMAKALDMTHLNSYQRLEHRANPTLNLLKKVHDRLPGFPFEMILS